MQQDTRKIVALLKDCAKRKDLSRGSSIHADIIRMGLLDTDDTAGSTLVSMYAKCGSLARAQEVFDTLPFRRVGSWNALITGYVQQGHSPEALRCFERMQREGTSPDAFTYVCTLKACGNVAAIDKGQEVHAQILKKGFLEKDIFVGTALVDMYAKCGLLAKAQEVFDELPVRDVVTWNALVAGYTQHGYGEKALTCFERMQLSSISPNAVTLVCILKACGSVGAMKKGEKLHDEIVKDGLLEKHKALGNALVDMYVKCGSTAKAQEVFEKLSCRDVVSWSVLIAGYATQGLGKEALSCFERMRIEGVSPNAVTFVCILKACGGIRDADNGQIIHTEIARGGFLEKHVAVGNALIDMYSKCGLIAKAEGVFNKLPRPDVVSWTALIAGYAQHGLCEEAMNCFKQMQLDGISPNAVTYVCILKVCGSLGAVEKGQEIHAKIAREGLLERHLVVGNALVDMYVKWGFFAKARDVLDKLQSRNVVSWSVLIAGFVQHGHGEEALKCFERMQLEGISPDTVTIVCILQGCGGIGATDKGQQIYEENVKGGLLERQAAVGTALVDMYAKCGLLAKALEVFDQLSVRDVATWTALIAGYAEHGHGGEALNCFEHMQRAGISSNAVTFVCILKACGSIGAAEKGQRIHAQIAREGLLGKEIVVGTALVDMYCKCGLLAKAHEVFDILPVQDVVLWSTLISGYVQHGQCQEALKCYEQMLCKGNFPDAVTFVWILKACGIIGAVDKGQQIHTNIVKEGLLEKHTVVSTTLVDMYAKCGLLAKAQEVFDIITVRDVVLWNALITGYALLGKAEKVFNSFDKMIGEGVKPDLITFNGVLNACSRAGLVDKGQMYFGSMKALFGTVQTFEHHACMVDLLGRAGHLYNAVAVIKRMPYSANLAVWHTVLNACRMWGSIEIGRVAFEHCLQLDEKDAAAYVCMSNIYSDAGREEDADQVEALRVMKQAMKKPRLCWRTDVRGCVHSFSVRDDTPLQMESICLAYEMSKEGCGPGLHWMSHDGFEKDMLCEHSEKLATHVPL